MFVPWRRCGLALIALCCLAGSVAGADPRFQREPKGSPERGRPSPSGSEEGRIGVPRIPRPTHPVPQRRCPAGTRGSDRRAAHCELRWERCDEQVSERCLADEERHPAICVADERRACQQQKQLCEIAPDAADCGVPPPPDAGVLGAP